jgi:hypothetical protein
LKIWRIAKQGSTRWGFLIGGEIDWDSFTDEEKSEIRAFLANPPEKSLFISRHLTELEFQKIIEFTKKMLSSYIKFFPNEL